jgi:hypothetical protein
VEFLGIGDLYGISGSSDNNPLLSDTVVEGSERSKNLGVIHGQRKRIAEWVVVIFAVSMSYMLVLIGL